MRAPAILVSHAYGGAVITQAGDDPKVKGLDYAGSPMPGVGESTNDCLQPFPGGNFASSVDLIPYTLPDGTSGTNVQVKADKGRYLLAADAPESVLALMIATQRPFNLAALNDERAHSHVIELNSSNAIPFSFPDVVVDVIKQSARVATK